MERSLESQAFARTACAALAAALLAGCYASHELGDADGGVVEAGMCSMGTGTVEIRTEIRTGSGPCDGHLDGMRVDGVDAEPSVNGIRIHTSYAGPDPVVMQCDFVVSGVGTDAATELGATTRDVTIDVQPERDATTYAYVSMRGVIGMPACVGACAPLVFYAARASIDALSAPPSDLAFSLGAPVCPASCTGGSWRLHAANVATGSGADVVPGGDARVGGATVRAVRDVEIDRPCAHCVECGAHVAAFAAWAVP